MNKLTKEVTLDTLCKILMRFRQLKVSLGPVGSYHLLINDVERIEVFNYTPKTIA